MARFPLAFAIGVVAAALAHAQPVALSVNPASREEVRQFYRAVYFASENVPMTWTGSYETGAAGDTSAAFKEATRLRVNFFRALAGLPASITFNATYGAKAQDAALMMSANRALSHFPPASWTFYTAAGAEAAASSNLNLGGAGPAAIDSYLADAGANNAAVGHRRWIFYPQTRQMGTGDVPGLGSSFPAANALWVFDDSPAGRFGAPRPATRSPGIAYPPAGFIPYRLVWPRWSFAFPGADFSAASVTMTRDGQPIAVALEPGASNIGEPTLVWGYDGQNTATATPHARPAADTTYHVTISNVRIGGAAQNFSYQVTVFDPDVAGPDATRTTIAGPTSPGIGQPNAYTVTKPDFAAGVEWRTLQLAAFTKTYSAESGLDGLVPTTTAGYDVVQRNTVAAGSAAYRLAHPSPRFDQILMLPETLHVTSASDTLSFRSRLGIATATETARVQISTDEGRSWTDVFTQVGASATDTGFPTANEAAFVARTLSLAAYSGRTINVRLAYTVGSGVVFLPQPTNTVGWFVDDLTLSQVQSVAAGATHVSASSDGFSFTPATAAPVGLQARGVMFTAFGLEWSPVLQVAPAEGGPIIGNPGRLINLSIRTHAGTGDNTLIVGLGVGGANTNGTMAALFRGVGPTLAQFGVTGFLPDPVITAYSGSTVLAENDDWRGGFDFAQVGAFALAGNPPRDAALYNGEVPAGSYSLHITGKNNATGLALAEVYDAVPTAGLSARTPRLVNLSARATVGTGDNILIAGFVVHGGPVRLLVRAVGPALAGFGVSTALMNPRLELNNATTQVRVGENDDWGGTVALKAAFDSVAAFQFADNSRDAAVVVTVPPGAYNAQIRGVNDTTGVALVEIYELP